MKNIVIISGHPNLNQSAANRTILDSLAQALPDTPIRRLDALYNGQAIDIAAEQEALAQADIIVWQFPLHWYNLPALMKSWLDQVFSFGFAYGPGAKLAGKTLVVSFTSGAKESDYAVGQAQNYPIETFIHAFRQTATMCGMNFGETVYSGGMLYIPGVHSEADLAAVQQKAQAHAQRLLAVLA